MPGQWLIPHGGSNRVNVTDTKPAATAAVLKANYVRRGTKDRGTGHVLQRVRLTGHRVIRPTTGDTERNSGSARDVLEQVAVHDVGGAVYRNDGLSWSRDPQRGEQVRGGIALTQPGVPAVLNLIGWHSQAHGRCGPVRHTPFSNAAVTP